ncbi:MAG: PDC sensor domain-containing protein [Halothiobacillaceae bacterium]
MADISYLGVIERYHEYEKLIKELLASIITGIADESLMLDQEKQRQALISVRERYPFVQILYVLNDQGVQISEFNVDVAGQVSTRHDEGKGRDRRLRPYFQQVQAKQGVIVTQPYLSSADSSLCLSTAMPMAMGAGQLGYLVLDIDLESLISFLMGDSQRRRFEPSFRAIYALIGASLLGVVGLLMVDAIKELVEAVIHPVETEHDKLRPFSIIVVITLAMAIFDLAKTTLEEEVFMHKDIYRHSATRRTITRFLAAIIIAVSIEGLLLMFKSAMGGGSYLLEAAFVMLAAAVLTVGLGLYVWLGARAEAQLVRLNIERNLNQERE